MNVDFTDVFRHCSGELSKGNEICYKICIEILMYKEEEKKIDFTFDFVK